MIVFPTYRNYQPAFKLAGINLRVLGPTAYSRKLKFEVKL